MAGNEDTFVCPKCGHAVPIFFYEEFGAKDGTPITGMNGKCPSCKEIYFSYDIDDILYGEYEP